MDEVQRDTFPRPNNYYYRVGTFGTRSIAQWSASAVVFGSYHISSTAPIGSFANGFAARVDDYQHEVRGA
jgi:hypothetical protein